MVEKEKIDLAMSFEEQFPSLDGKTYFASGEYAELEQDGNAGKCVLIEDLNKNCVDKKKILDAIINIKTTGSGSFSDRHWDTILRQELELDSQMD